MAKRISIIVSVLRILPVWTVRQVVGGGCGDNLAWKDSGGDGCDWYAKPEFCEEGHPVNSENVKKYISMYTSKHASYGISAIDACCGCGGGTHTPIDGAWSAWTAVGRCGATSGKSQQIWRRSCTSPTPQYNGATCVGRHTKRGPCQHILPACPVNGAWGSWQNLHDCSVTCGEGIQVETRACDSPTPIGSDSQCIGDSVRVSVCKRDACPAKLKDDEGEGTGVKQVQSASPRTCTCSQSKSGGGTSTIIDGGDEESRSGNATVRAKLYFVYFPGNMGSAFKQATTVIAGNVGTFTSKDVQKISEVIHQAGGMEARRVSDENTGRKLVDEASRAAALWNADTKSILHFQQPFWSFTNAREQLKKFAEENCK